MHHDARVGAQRVKHEAHIAGGLLAQLTVVGVEQGTPRLEEAGELVAHAGQGWQNAPPPSVIRGGTIEPVSCQP